MHPSRPSRPILPRRSALSVPAANLRALEKAPTLDADVLILDLEDSVAEEKKDEARGNLRQVFGAEGAAGKRAFRVIRINALSSRHAEADLKAVFECRPDALLLPKVETPRDILEVADRLAERDGLEELRIWAMIETPKGVLNAALIAEAAHTPDARLDAFVIGLNDLRNETGIPPEPSRQHLLPFMMSVLLAARAYGLDVLDSVCNDFRDGQAFEAECAQGRAMGFDGKMLIHPDQIEPANRHFGPSPQALAQARAIVAAFEAPAAEGLGVIDLDGRMVERLHLDAARRLLQFDAAITSPKRSS